MIKRRRILSDGSFIEESIHPIRKDKWRPHGVKYRLAWIVNGVCKVRFDNHSGKGDHFHVDNKEYPYKFVDTEKLIKDFVKEIKKLGGSI